MRQVRQIARSFEEGTLLFIEKLNKLGKNRCKNDAKSCSKQQGHETRWKMRLHTNILSANCDFWSILGPPGLPKWVPKLTLGFTIRAELARGVPREPQEPILESFWGPQMAILGPYWDAFGSKQQQTAANSSSSSGSSKQQQLAAAACSKQQQITANSST